MGAPGALPVHWHGQRIGIDQAWAAAQGADGVVVAIVDSGVDRYHPDLAGQVVAGFNTYDKSGNSADQFGHGTKVAGLAALARRSPIMPVRVTDRAGRSTAASISKGIVWAVDHGARVVNVSLDGVLRSEAIRAAAQYAHEHGALVVAPAGNCGCIDPAAETPFVLSVAATDQADAVASFSSGGAYVDVAAPGVGIATTGMYGLSVRDSGTSLASGIVAGVAALMFSVNPALTPAIVTRLLETTALNPGGTGRDAWFGHGRIDAAAAVRAAANYRGEGESVDDANAGRAAAPTVFSMSGTLP